MADSGPFDPNEDDFARLVKQGAEELRAQRGPCPNEEVLAAFHYKRLSKQEADQVQHHVEACGLCDAELGQFGLKRDRLGADGQVSSRYISMLVPYALVLLLIYPAYRGLFRDYGKSTEEPHQHETEVTSGNTVSAIRSFSLEATRGGSEAGRQASVGLSANDQTFLLSFFVPIKASKRYSVVVFRREGIALAASQDLTKCDNLGNCFLVCDAAPFTTGQYRLEVTEISPEGSAVKFPFPFSVLKQEPRSNSPPPTKNGPK